MQTIALLISFSHPHAYHDDARVSVFSLFFPFFPFLFTLQIYLLYKLLRHCVDIQVCLLLTIFAPDVSTPLCFSSFSITHAFHSSKVQFTSADLTISFYTSRNARNIFPHSANFPLFPFSLALSILLSNNSHETILHIQKEEREIVYRKSHPLSLSFSLRSFCLGRRDNFFFFFKIYLSAAETDLQVGMYTTLYLPTRYKKFYALYMRIALCTQNFTRRRRGSTTSLVSLSRLAGNLSCLSCSFSLLSLYHK